MPAPLTEAHQQKIDQLCEKLETEKLCRHTSRSHMTRGVGKPVMSLSPYLKDFREILLYDPSVHRVWAEAGITVEELVRWSLSRGVLPPVVPEFKKITLGGAITGTALESSSFQHGQCNDPCLEYEVLSPQGTLRRSSPSENADLFDALPGSYGTLGGLTAVHLPLLPAKDFVLLECTVVESVSDALALFQEKIPSSEYLDAVILSPQRIVVMSGRQVFQKNVPSSSEPVRFFAPWSEWWISRISRKAEREPLWHCHFPLYDYLFRFDRGAFWMGQFITQKTLPQFLFEYGFRRRSLSNSLHGAFHQEPPSLHPHWTMRLLTGWKLSSHQLYRVLHAMPEQALRETFFVHDFYLPWNRAAAFIQHVEEELEIFPLWLCPIKGSTKQFLSPHYCTASRAPQPDFVNVGIYGVPSRRKEEIRALTRETEQTVRRLGGRKMLYSANEYRREEFWEIYDRKRYQDLRVKYDCTGYPDLFQKI